MPYYSQQDYSAYEMPNSDYAWQSLPGEELFTGGAESNTIINPVFDAELLTNWQMPNPDQVHLSGEPFLENAQFSFHAGLTAHHWQIPMANHSLRDPMNEGSASQMPQTHQSLRRPFSREIPANQIEYPVPYRSPYPALEQREGGDNVHQRGQTTQGKNLCPIVGCRRSYGRGLCRPDKVNDHLKKVHGLVRVAPNGTSASAGPSANGTGDGFNVAGGATALARNGN
ncbi:hypothetical protein EAE99_006924 [Botrytis elliptica]|nr:hypothetical protein EAE99_006924 [Botrytis elliptica]